MDKQHFIDTFFAHSGNTEKQIPPQTYHDHINSVYLHCKKEKNKLSNVMLRKGLLYAALFHDFGKLHQDNQELLRLPDKQGGSLPYNHVDAGVAWCLGEYQSSLDESLVYAAILILAHHIGIENFYKLFERGKLSNNPFSSPCLIKVKSKIRDKKIEEITDSLLPYFQEIQLNLFGQEIKDIREIEYENKDKSFSSMDFRFAFSILIDADRTDAANYGYTRTNDRKYLLNPNKRIEILDKHIESIIGKSIQKGISQEVIKSRNVLYDIASKVDVSKHSFFEMSAPTGKGKTLSLVKLSLRIAKEKNRDKIFYVVPYTNVIDQSVTEYQKSLCFEYENKDEVVSPIHSKVEFDNPKLRRYSQSFSAPILAMTSVRFLEAMFSNYPSTLKNLYKYANSVVILDEYQSFLSELPLWNISLCEMNRISKDYNIDFVFGSGSQIHFWELFDGYMPEVNDIISDEVYQEFMQQELERIKFIDLGEFDDEDSFYGKVNSLILGGSALIVMNTINNAAMVAEHLSSSSKAKVFHLSSALAPVHRGKIQEEIRICLDNKENIIVVSTSLMECGIDLSFDVSFRERSSMSSVIQIGGRTNRNKTSKEAFVYEFSFEKGKTRFNENSLLRNAIRARNGLEVSPINCTAAICNELSYYPDKNILLKEESRKDFKSVAEEYEVIKNLTVTVLVDEELAGRIENGDYVPGYVISRYSVSVYGSKIVKKNGDAGDYAPFVRKIDKDIYLWTGKYDTKYGYYSQFVNQ